MTKSNQSGNVISAVQQDDGTVVVGIDSRRTNEAGEPSFKMTYTFPAGSPSPARYPVGTIVTLAVETITPQVDQITGSKTLESSSAIPEPAETPVAAPTSIDQSAPVNTPADVPAPPEALPGDDELPETFVTPASDIPAPTLTVEQPAVVTSNLMANAPIADVKAALGL